MDTTSIRSFRPLQGSSYFLRAIISPCPMPQHHYEPPQNDSLIDMLLSLPRHLRTLFGHPTEEDKAENLKEHIKKELDRHMFK